MPSLAPKRTLIEITKEAVGEKIKKVDVEDRETREPLEHLEELKQGMTIHVRLVPDLRKERLITATYKVLEDLSGVELLGQPLVVGAKMEPLENLYEEIDEAEVYKVGKQIENAVSRYLKQMQSESS